MASRPCVREAREAGGRRAAAGGVDHRDASEWLLLRDCTHLSESRQVHALQDGLLGLVARAQLQHHLARRVRTHVHWLQELRLRLVLALGRLVRVVLRVRGAAVSDGGRTLARRASTPAERMTRRTRSVVSVPYIES